MSLADEIMNENVAAVNAILQTGVDLNQLDEYGFTYLTEAAIADNFQMANLLIAQGANPNLQDSTGGTPLQWAAENNNFELCRLLLKAGANPNSYNFAGQPVLTMPLLRRQRKVKDLLLHYGADLFFAQDFINTKLLGHMFELVGTADLIDPQNNFVEVDFEGFFLEFSMGVIGDSLAQFQNHFAARNLRRYSEYAQVALHMIERGSQLIRFQQYRTDLPAQQMQIDALIQQEPLIIPVGYEGHAITFVKFGNILAQCDRRTDSRHCDTIVFYLVNKPHNLTASFIKNLMFEKTSDQFINVDIHQILGLKPLTELKVDAQISGNCSWANVEGVIPIAIYLLLLSTAQQSETNSSQFKSIALNYYTQWREWNKDRALQFCIQSFRDSDTIRNVCKAEILAAILFQRCKYENMVDRERIENIMAVLTQAPYRHVLQNYIKSYGYESKSLEGQEFLKMLRMVGYL
jgi:hypothetical protein